MTSPYRHNDDVSSVSTRSVSKSSKDASAVGYSLLGHKLGVRRTQVFGV